MARLDAEAMDRVPRRERAVPFDAICDEFEPLPSPDRKEFRAMIAASEKGSTMKLGLSILAVVLGIFAARGLSATLFGPQSLSHHRVMSSPPLQSAAMPARPAAPASKPVDINKVRGFGSRPGG